MSVEIQESASFLKLMKSRLDENLAEHRDHDDDFRQRNYERWKTGLDLLKMFQFVSGELGATYNERSRPKAIEDQNVKFEAIVSLHARAVRVSDEMVALLFEGFPDGALSRWRTLHELAVVATFLNRNDNETAKRFISHRGIVAYKALKQYDEYLPRSNMMPLEAGELEKALAQRNSLVVQFGPEFKEEMGWAYPAIQKKKGINLLDLEGATGLDHWRPRYKWACDDIHAGFRPYNASLGVAESPTDVLLIGRSNSAFTDPAHMMAISLNLVNNALPPEYLSQQDNITLGALLFLRDEIGTTFHSIQSATHAKRT